MSKETNWVDSGYDCDHCGGEIAQLKARKAARPSHAYYRCRHCGCEWTRKGDVVRIGEGAACRPAQGQRMSQAPPPQSWRGWLTAVPRWARIVVAVLLLLLLLRFAPVGFLLLRFLLPVALVGFIVYLVVRLGREQQWW